MASDKPVQWRTPDGVMRRIRLRKLQSQNVRRASLSNLSLNNQETSNASPLLMKKNDSETSSVKRQNPFAKKRPASESADAIKKRILSSSEYERNVENIPQKIPLNQSDEILKTNEGTYQSNTNNSNSSHIISDSNHHNSNQTEAKDPAMPFVYLEEDSIQGIFTNTRTEANTLVGSETLPMDWTIKRKARFLSKSTFAWCSRIKGAEEANAITQATRCHHKVIESKPYFGPVPDSLQKSWRMELMKSITYWQQPCVPWLTLYPRYGQQQKLHNSAMPAIPQTEDVTKSFYENWVTSFRSAYQLVREKSCPYFYVCAQQYTALFRAASVSGENEISCLLTPTTTGLRLSLEKEGIEFTLPLLKTKKVENTTEQNENKENEQTTTTSGINETDKIEDRTKESQSEDDATWDMISENIQMSTTKDLRQNAHTETSVRNVVYVKGNTNTQLLFNYLLNSKSSIQSSGVQSHVPPTILSPVAFQGASLQKLSIRSGIARTFTEASLNRGQGSSNRGQGSNDGQNKFSLDITGPLLPHSRIGILELLKKTQSPSGFQAAFSSSMFTMPFNSCITEKKNLENGKKGMIAESTEFQQEHDENSQTSFNPCNSSPKKVFGNKISENPQLLSKSENFGLSDTCLLQFKNADSADFECLNQVTLNNSLYTWNT